MRTKIIYLLLVGSLLLLCHVVRGQSAVPTTGKVITTTDGKGLPGATIKFVNTRTNQKTEIAANQEGIFNVNNLSAAEVYNIYVHHIGYQSDSILNFTVSANKNNSVLVRLKPDATSIDEVVVIGYGTALKKDLTGAISTMDGKDVATRKTTQLSQALQGAIPGVMVTRGS